ncbi:hypothetical protein [Nonomuraea bangladeshensis]|uniref:hypothetical protein n=1 Tax=Nonomuraea bangladeshensis TaxID=404385 RepID=UPI003C30D1B7
MAIFRQSLWPEDAAVLGSSFPAFDKVNGTSSPVPRLLYDAGTTETAFWRWWAVNYPGGDITVELVWYAVNATSGVVRWEVAMAAITPESDTQDAETDPLATAVTVDDTHLGTTSKRLMKATATLTGTSLDGVADGDHCVLKVARIGGNAADTMSNDAALIEVRLTYGS